jgi:hypothetical protein
MKNKKTDIKLYTKPEKNKPFKYWEFVWLTTDEVTSYTQLGYIRIKNLKKKGY